MASEVAPLFGSEIAIQGATLFFFFYIRRHLAQAMFTQIYFRWSLSGVGLISYWVFEFDLAYFVGM